MKGRKSILTIAALMMGVAIWTVPGSARADFVGPLVECTQVTEPAALTTCAGSQDPLTRGNAVIDDAGNLDLVVIGAGANQTYSIVFRSIDGSTFTIGSVTTGPSGNANKLKYAAIPFGKDAAGSLVLTRSGGDQFITSLFVRPAMSMSTRASFHADLMACNEVNDPKAITGCGSDSFKSGSVDVRSDTGEVTVQVNGAEVDATYAVFLRSPNNTSTLSLGTVGPTDSKGDATADNITTVPASTIGAGTVVLSRNSADQAYGGVRVTEKQPKTPISGSRLVRCEDVNFPPTATPTDSGDTCGTDPLVTGSTALGQAGTLTVSLTGAAASTTYVVFFRPIDTTGNADVDTGISLTTGSNGNGHASGSAATSGDVGAGTVVIKHGGVDEFFAGFSIK